MQQSSTGAAQTSNTQQPSGSSFKATSRADIECYKCHKKGHIANNCIDKREVTCYKCNETGHIAKNCGKSENLNKASMKLLENAASNNVSKHCKIVKIGNVDKVNVLIDTGRSDCTIRSSLVLENYFKFIRSPSTLIGFGKSGNEVKSSGIIRENLIVDRCSGSHIVFRVVPDDVQPYDIIIGRSFTELPHVSYYKIDDKLVFQEREQSVFAENPVIEHRDLRITSVETVKLPPASMNCIKGM